MCFLVPIAIGIGRGGGGGVGRGGGGGGRPTSNLRGGSNIPRKMWVDYWGGGGGA